MKKNFFNNFLLFIQSSAIFIFIGLLSTAAVLELITAPVTLVFAGESQPEIRLASAIPCAEKSPYHNYFYRESEDEITSDGFCSGSLEENAPGIDLEKAFKGKQKSDCIKFDDVKGSGKYPYNFRVIDNKLFAGGNLFNPVTLKNSPERVKKYLMLLKLIGARNIVALNVPLNHGRELKLIKEFCVELNINFYACRMNSETVPDDTQTETIMRMIDEGAYIHCNWGCDRTGAIIARYLVARRGYNGEEAFNAVISKGSHSGLLGGLKQTPTYKKLVLYFWPDIAAQNPETASRYEIAANSITRIAAESNKK